MASSKSTFAPTFKDFIALTKISEDTFETQYYPEKMGNAAAIAYGGCAVGVALNAAFQTLPASPTFHLYSHTGYFLGPASTDRKLICRVRRIRDTRTFATRSIEVSQETDVYKSERKILIATADFQIAEPASMFEYSAAPTRAYAGVTEQLNSEDYFAAQVTAKRFSQKAVDAWRANFGLFARFFEAKTAREGTFAQNLMGSVKDIATTQDALPFIDRTSADYFRVRHALATEAERVCAAGFAMDAAIAFLPLAHSHRYLDDTSACSSLDFALRIFGNEVDLNDWHFREMTTIAGAAGRTYSEARLWDSKGKMVASMTQQSIMRPLKKQAPKL